jgi:hypothetical protein
MDLAAHYAALMAPPEACILRRRLLPFTVGHAKLLPALGIDRVETLPELLAALSVCSVPAAVAWRRLRQRWWRWRIQLWAFFIALAFKASSGKLACGQHVLFLAARAQWAQYVAHYWAIPHTAPTREPTGASMPPGGPFLAHVEHILTAECGLTPDQVQDLPLNEAFWRYTIALEAAGSLTLQETEELSPEEYDLAQADADANHEAWLKASNNGRSPTR